MKKILVLNVGFSNKGAYALISSTMETIEKYVPDVQFTFMGTETNQNKIPIKKQLAIKPFKNLGPWKYLFICFLINIFNRFGVKIPVSKKSHLYEYYISDLVLNSGGDHLSGEKFGLSSLLNIYYAILLNKPVVLYGESLGYFKNCLFNYLAKKIFNKVDLIIVREKISKKYLDDCGITNPKIYLTADSAFLLSPSPQSRVCEILSEEGIGYIQRPLIGINVSGLISNYRNRNSQTAEIDIITIFSKVIDTLINDLSSTILLIPHVYTKNVDDRVIINKIMYESTNKSKIYAINNEYTPQELKGIIGLCDLFIGARMHSTIASTSMLVPTVGIAYSHKMYGVIGDMLGQGNYVIDINDLTYENLISTINHAWKNREKISNDLKLKIPILKQTVLLNGLYVKELLYSSQQR
ncbi:polysaccharide pyruvyl transferase family protein [Methanosarcina hadiensis]|uniref:polysaccharide pyruvyl transferase family protein n=1 Tax=Methanosarcina hadiensis TaxID=3078083 RepID=UPI003977CAFB